MTGVTGETLEEEVGVVVEIENDESFEGKIIGVGVGEEALAILSMTILGGMRSQTRG